MQLQFDDTDRAILARALENYRINRSAQRMLDGQRAMKQNDHSESDKIFARYDSLLARVKTLQEKLA